MNSAVIGPKCFYCGGAFQQTILYTRHKYQVDFIPNKRQCLSFLCSDKSDKNPNQTYNREPCDFLLDSVKSIMWSQLVRRFFWLNPKVLIMVV